MEKDIKLFKFYDNGILRYPNNSKGKKESKPKPVQLYKLNIKSPEDLSYSYDLPPQFRHYLDEAVFALPYHAIDTIDYLLSEAPVQAHMPLYRGYDTIIRDRLHELGKNFIQKAVFLLCDYYYDEKTQYFHRYNDEMTKQVLEKLILYKYWQGRTGRGMQSFFSGFNDVKYNKDSHAVSSDYYIAQQIKMYEALQEKSMETSKKGYIEEMENDDIIKETVALSLDKDLDDDGEDRTTYPEFIVEINYGILENCESENIENKIRIYSIFTNDENTAKTLAINELHHEYDTSKCIYDLNIIKINNVIVKKGEKGSIHINKIETINNDTDSKLLIDEEVTEDFINSLDLSVREVEDLLWCFENSKSMCESPYGFYAGYAKSLHCSSTLKEKNLVQFISEDSPEPLSPEQSGWYLTKMGYKTICKIVELYYNPYLKDFFFKDQFIKENFESLYYNGDDCVFFKPKNLFSDNIEVNIRTNKIECIWVAHHYKISNFGKTVVQYAQFNDFLKVFQDKLNHLPSADSFYKIYKK